jgi:phosphate transport system permease protein
MAYQDHLPDWELGYPSEDDLQKLDRKRSRTGQIWAVIFSLSTLVGVVVLMVLLLSIVNNSFGYTAVFNQNDPRQLVIWVLEREMLNAPNTLASEDDRELVQGVASNASAGGFFGYAYYANQGDKLKALAVEGVEPNADSVASGEYPLARPLYIYSDAKTMASKPEVASFIDFYLRNVLDVIEAVGYFPISEDEIQASLDKLTELGIPAGEEAQAQWTGAGIVTAGSSTVAPVTMQISEDFAAATGYPGDIEIDVIGSTAGIQRFCAVGDADIANASRAITPQEDAACKRRPLEFHIGTDAIAIVHNPANALDGVSLEQLQALFTTAKMWSDVDPSLPSEPIYRFIPDKDSGTLDSFVDKVFSDVTLADLSSDQLILILESSLSEGRIRALNAQQPLAERTHSELLQLVEVEVVKPNYVATYGLFRSILDRQSVEEDVASIPGAVMTWKNWVSWKFITSPQSSNPATAGVATAILGSLWVVVIAILFSIPLGIGAAIWLEEYADKKSRFANIIDTNINNLAGVPSIIYGLLGLAVFVRFLEPFTSGQFLGVVDDTTANGRTILSAGLTLGLLILPLVIINSREAIRAVPNSLREASYGMGATRWQTTWVHLLPNAITGMLTGSILAVSRAIGETAPLVVVGASTFINTNPSSPFAKFTTLPVQIFQWTSRPQPAFQNIAAAASIVLLALLILLNAVAVFMRNRYSRRTV